MIGSTFFGLLSDGIGRIKAMLVGLCLTSISGAIGAFMPEVISFGIMRFLSGVGAKGLFMIAFVLSVELTGPQYSAYLGKAIEKKYNLRPFSRNLPWASNATSTFKYSKSANGHTYLLNI